ncbi:hypothetical protein [Halegenticoccus tardaugens]|uniref:hypothetical protein n=1 Tax=Halegenticoccus tardaugens TaxID=2071624 RepID=UPI00100BEF67|nr:hypothetical protein [Halegenticoccus tardaugens]
MPPFATRLADGWNAAQSNLPLALVPLVTALLDTNKVGKVLANGGMHFGLQFGLPAGVVDLWQFVSVPNGGATVDPGVGGVGTGVGLLLLPIALAVQAALSAGYFGSVRDALRAGSYDFSSNARRYFLPFLLYALVPVLLSLPLAFVATTGASRSFFVLFLVLILAIPVVTYLFYATPYLVVLRETDLLSAARGSYALAIAGGPYLTFALNFAAFVLASSLLATAVVVNLGAAGVVLGALAAAPVGLAANAMTMRFVADVDPRSPPLGTWGDEDGGNEEAAEDDETAEDDGAGPGAGPYSGNERRP